MNSEIRSHFPALSRVVDGFPIVFLDGPAGTQVPQTVLDATVNYLGRSNSNTHGFFPTSRETDDVLSNTRQLCATLLNAESPECVSFGPNMTTIALKLSRAFGRMFEPGDEVVITQLDHEANRGPWLTLEENGVIVKEILLKNDGTLDYEDAARKINNKTRLVAAGAASNILGTVNNIAELRQLSRAVGAWLLVDAVHYTPHFLTDVQDMDCDFLLCSGYKFYGPHVGLLYCKPGLLEQLPVDFLRTQSSKAPSRIETGTTNHAAIAGTGAVIEYLASLGAGSSTREKLASAYHRMHAHEQRLARRLWDGLKSLPGVTMYGPDMAIERRSPTLSFTIEGRQPSMLCKFLGDRGICAWNGHFYALRTIEVYDLVQKGGVTRMGVVLYNSDEEIDRTIAAVSEFIDQHP